MKRRKMARIEDLERAEHEGRVTSLRCPVCGADYSACLGDYFWAKANHAFRCGCTRGRPGLVLVDR